MIDMIQVRRLYFLNSLDQIKCLNRLENIVCTVMLQSFASDASELRKLLSRNWIEGLLYAHDKIATRRMSPTSVSASASQVDSGAHALSVNDGTTDVLLERLKNYQEHGNNIKVVRIEKTIEPLGATVKVSIPLLKIILNVVNKKPKLFIYPI